MNWPITHMVAPERDAVRCQECHMKGGRLDGIDGIYLPGRDRNPLLDFIGWGIVLLAAGGSLIHGLIRVVTASRKGKHS
jgi:hypothetical protein